LSPSDMVSVPPPDLSSHGKLQIIGIPENEPAAAAEPVSIPDLEKAVEEAQEPAERAVKRLLLARALLDEGHVEDGEKLLWISFAEGSAPAGELLSAELEADSARTPELVRVRRQLVDMAPGDVGRLEALIAAAQADHNAVYARALEHVLRA